jgi:hypothetical protein
MKWIKLYVLNNCFNDKHKKHLGVKYNGVWFAITHKGNDNCLIIPDSCFKIKEKSNQTKYLKKIINSAPNIVNPINAFIEESLLLNYNQINKI